MTSDVVTTSADTPFKELAALMARRGVSALPVLDASGQLAGVVSEADLLPKQGIPGRPGGQAAAVVAPLAAAGADGGHGRR
jgi:CBS domain-containing protein